MLVSYTVYITTSYKDAAMGVIEANVSDHYLTMLFLNQTWLKYGPGVSHGTRWDFIRPSAFIVNVLFMAPQLFQTSDRSQLPHNKMISILKNPNSGIYFKLKESKSARKTMHHKSTALVLRRRQCRRTGLVHSSALVDCFHNSTNCTKKRIGLEFVCFIVRPNAVQCTVIRISML